MPGIPDFKPKKFYHRNWFAETITGIGVLISSGSGVAIAIPVFLYPDERTTGTQTALAIGAIAGAALAVVGAIVKVVQGHRKDSVDKDEERLDGLHASLEIIHSLVRHQVGFPRSNYGMLRLTIHKRVGNEMEQLFNYIGGPGGGKGRRFPVGLGICGKVLREGKVYTFSRTTDDDDAYIQELVRDWGFDQEQALRLTFGRNAWMAVPIKYSDRRIAGVIYLDAKHSGFFTDDIANLVTWACGGVAVFINERYR